MVKLKKMKVSCTNRLISEAAIGAASARKYCMQPYRAKS